MNPRQEQLDGRRRPSFLASLRATGLLAATLILLAGCETTDEETNRVYDGDSEVLVDENGREMHPSRAARFDDDDGWRVRKSTRGQADSRSW